MYNLFVYLNIFECLSETVIETKNIFKNRHSCLPITSNTTLLKTRMENDRPACSCDYITVTLV